MTATTLGHVATAAWACASLLWWASAASAQTRDGFHFGIGGGAGWATVTCEECGDRDRQGGGSGYVTAGWTLNPHLVIGGDLQVWTRRDDLGAATQWSYRYIAAATATVYPSSRSGFFVKGGAGMSYVDLQVDSPAGDADLDIDEGPGVLVAAGIDIPLGGRVALTPAIAYWHSWFDDLEARGGAYETRRRQRVVVVTLGITFP
ncbi:MAG: outer membrane beta-barrel protein [Vicinamibacterales bacterium]